MPKKIEPGGCQGDVYDSDSSPTVRAVRRNFHRRPGTRHDGQPWRLPPGPHNPEVTGSKILSPRYYKSPCQTPFRCNDKRELIILGSNLAANIGGQRLLKLTELVDNLGLPN